MKITLTSTRYNSMKHLYVELDDAADNHEAPLLGEGIATIPFEAT